MAVDVVLLTPTMNEIPNRNVLQTLLERSAFKDVAVTRMRTMSLRHNSVVVAEVRIDIQ